MSLVTCENANNASCNNACCKVFFTKADADGSGEISKSEFEHQLSLRGTLARIDALSGKMLSDRTGSNLMMVHFLQVRSSLQCVAVCCSVL